MDADSVERGRGLGEIMPAEYQRDVTFDEVQVGDLILVELFDGDGSYLGDRRGVAKELKHNSVWIFDGMYPVYKDAAGYRLFKVLDLDGDPEDVEDRTHLNYLRNASDVDKVLLRAEYSDSTDALVLAGEIRRLRRMEDRVKSLLAEKRDRVAASIASAVEISDNDRVNGLIKSVARLKRECRELEGLLND